MGIGAQQRPGLDPARDATAPSRSDRRRVVIVDDHELLRTGTRRILEDAQEFEVVGEAADGETALEVVGRELPDLALVDIRLPKMNGIEFARKVTAEHPSTIVLILSAYDDEHYVRAAMSAGVSGYLLKTAPGDELISAIRAVCERSASFTPAPSRWSGDGGEKIADLGSADDRPCLTTRETEVVRLVARSFSNKAIAHELGISPRTVEGHLNHVYEKLGVTSRTELVHFALATTLFSRDRVARDAES